MLLASAEGRRGEVLGEGRRGEVLGVVYHNLCGEHGSTMTSCPDPIRTQLRLHNCTGPQGHEVVLGAVASLVALAAEWVVVSEAVSAEALVVVSERVSERGLGGLWVGTWGIPSSGVELSHTRAPHSRSSRRLCLVPTEPPNSQNPHRNCTGAKLLSNLTATSTKVGSKAADSEGNKK